MNFHGEPVPPGFESESRSPQIRPVIDRYKSGALIGLEYTVEVYSAKDKEPFYMCLLCDKRGDPRTIFSHWISYNHRMKYLEKYFPVVAEQLTSYKGLDSGRTNLPGAVQIIIEAIEKRHGRLYPFVYERAYFQRNRDSILDDIEDSDHFDERQGENFLSYIDRKVLDPLGNHTEKPFSKDPSPPIVKPPVKRPGPIKVTLNTKSLPNDNLDAISSGEEENGSGGKKKKSEQSPAYRVTPRVHRSPPFDEPTAKKDNLKEKNPFPTPRELSLQAGQIAQEKYKWEKYRCSAEIAEKELTKKLKEFEKNPEKHPMYPDEWKKFWNRRYKELQQQKKDPNNYDYKPEWIVFWTRRMKELHEKDLEKKKVELKLKLGLPPDGEEMTDALKSQYKVDNPKKVETVEQVIDISDEEDNFLEVHSKRRPPKDRASRDRRNSRERRDTKERDIRRKRRSMSRSLSPLSDESGSSYRRRKRDSHRSRSRSRSKSRSMDRGDWDRKYPPHAYPYPPYGRGFPPMYPRPPMGYPGYGAPYRPPYSKYAKYEEYEENSKSPLPSDHKKKDAAKEEEPEQDEPLTVVAVLRLLTALEDYLGSLGPKVVDMLGKALALEKIKSNSSDDLLINEDNCVFFETIKEKLKGQLLANVLDDQLKIKAIKKAIKNIAGIIYQVSCKATKNESTNSNPADKEKQPAVPKTAKKISDLPFERSVISSKLAAALVTEGKEDVSTDDMDKLIFLLILMVKISKGADKNVNSKEICEFLNIPRPKSPALPTPTKQVMDMFSKEEIESMKMVVNAKEVRKEVEAPKAEPKDASAASGLDCLTDSDLQTLLQNFKHLSSEEQHHLIAHLKKLESTDPLRVEKLRKYVNISDDDKTKKSSFEIDDDDDDSRSRSVTYSNRDESPPPPPPCKPDSRKINISDDEDDEDYNFEDVVKSITASNMQPKQALNPQRPSAPSTSASKSTAPISITDTQNLIANLMGSLQKTGNNSATSSVQPPQPPTQPKSIQPPQPPSSMPYYQQQQQQFISYPHLNPQQQQQNSQMNAAANPYYNYYQQQPQPPQMNYNNAYNMGYPQGVPQMPNFNMFNQNMPMNNGRGGNSSGHNY